MISRVWVKLEHDGLRKPGHVQRYTDSLAQHVHDPHCSPSFPAKNMGYNPIYPASGPLTAGYQPIGGQDGTETHEEGEHYYQTGEEQPRVTLGRGCELWGSRLASVIHVDDSLPGTLSPI